MIQNPEAAILPDASLEIELDSFGLGPVCGIDEAGRGSWAGPVFAAAVILPLHSATQLAALDGVRDSKMMTFNQRERWSERLKASCLTFGIGQASHGEIDQRGIVPSTRLAMMRAISRLDPPPAYLMLDYILLPALELPQTSLPHGDARVLSIAAASILAKVARDHHMIQLDDVYPGYGFKSHKGYGTSFHRERLFSHGPCPIHRRSYAPIKDMIADPETQQ